MNLSHKHVGLKILAKIKLYVLSRAELLFPLCYEIPCTSDDKANILSNIDDKNQIEHVVLTEKNPRNETANHQNDNEDILDKAIDKSIPEKCEIGAVEDLKKYECFACDKKFSVKQNRRKHMTKFHKNVCHICGSTFQTVQEITKHIAGNLHDIRAFLY